MRRDLITAYSPLFYKQEAKYAPSYHRVADWLLANLDFQNVLDMGCGNGMIIDYIRATNISVKGIDGSVHAKAQARPSIRPFISTRDVTPTLDLQETYDLVVCTEFAQCFDVQDLDGLVRMLVHHANTWLFFSAFNERLDKHKVSQQDWTSKFLKAGASLDKDKTEMFRARVKADVIPWFKGGAMIFRRLA